MGRSASLPPDLMSAVRQAEITAKTAVMRVEVTGNVGYLFFLNGELVHASTLEFEGDDAVRQIAAWDQVTLDWCERRWPRTRSVTRSFVEVSAELAMPAAPEEAPAPSSAPVSTPAPPLREPRETEIEAVVSFPSALGLRQVLSRAELKNALRLNKLGGISDSRGSSGHLKPILRSTLMLGDLLGAVFGLGPLIAAEASSQNFHRLVARSSEDASAVETLGGNGLQLARAFLKLS
jgi:hypothetical protein